MSLSRPLPPSVHPSVRALCRQVAIILGCNGTEGVLVAGTNSDHPDDVIVFSFQTTELSVRIMVRNLMVIVYLYPVDNSVVYQIRLTYLAYQGAREGLGWIDCNVNLNTAVEQNLANYTALLGLVRSCGITRNIPQFPCVPMTFVNMRSGEMSDPTPLIKNLADKILAFLAMHPAPVSGKPHAYIGFDEFVAHMGQTASGSASAGPAQAPTLDTTAFPALCASAAKPVAVKVPVPLTTGAVSFAVLAAQHKPEPLTLKVDEKMKALALQNENLQAKNQVLVDQLARIAQLEADARKLEAENSKLAEQVARKLAGKF